MYVKFGILPVLLPTSMYQFVSLILSQVAQKAIFEKIKAEDPELVAVQEREAQVAAVPSTKANAITFNEEPANPLQEVPQLVVTQKTPKTGKGKEPVEHVCPNGKETFTGKTSRAKYCSQKCKTAYYRKEKRYNISNIPRCHIHRLVRSEIRVSRNLITGISLGYVRALLKWKTDLGRFRINSAFNVELIPKLKI